MQFFFRTNNKPDRCFSLQEITQNRDHDFLRESDASTNPHHTSSWIEGVDSRNKNFDEAPFQAPPQPECVKVIKDRRLAQSRARSDDDAVILEEIELNQVVAALSTCGWDGNNQFNGVGCSLPYCAAAKCPAISRYACICSTLMVDPTEARMKFTTCYHDVVN
jgi:hypothetical protein